MSIVPRFDQVAWVGIETAIIWQCSPGTVETQRLYPPRAPKGNQGWIFCLINPIICSPYLAFHSRVRTEFVTVLIRNPFLDEASLFNSSFVCLPFLSILRLVPSLFITGTTQMFINLMRLLLLSLISRFLFF